MDTTHWLILALGSLLVGVATWIACWLWYGRKIESLNQRLHKSEKARHFSNQQTLQARKQLEALRRTLGALGGHALVGVVLTMVGLRKRR